ncbi:MAG: Cupredoxin-like domain [Acidimicrobiaceae bacterium]|jgi:plastocyanin
MTRFTVSVRVAAVAVVATAALSAQASAAVSTTNPQVIRDMRVVLTERGAHLSLSKVSRGSLVRFFVRNAGTKPTDFVIGGYFVHKLMPGHRKNFQLQFLERGRYPYYSVAHPGTKVKGVLVVT